MSNIAIILAAGSGKRFGQDKSIFKINQQYLISHSLTAFLSTELIDQIIITVNKDNKKIINKIISTYPNKNIALVDGGNSRFESTLNAINSIKIIDTDNLIFHNAANPFVTAEEIINSIDAATKYQAVGVAHNITNTLRIIEDNKSHIIPREKAYLMETPQVLKANVYLKGAKLARENSIDPTDDLALAELIGIKPKIIKANKANKKITFKSDLIMNLKKEECRVGLGEDSHRFGKSGKCILGGLVFSNYPKLEGNSDGDAAIHAITNAILSSIGQGSLSRFSDKMCSKGIKDSGAYLKVALNKLADLNGSIINISLSFECKKPKLEERLPEMQSYLANIIKINKEKIGLTATSGEGLSAFGRGEGVKVKAIALIKLS